MRGLRILFLPVVLAWSGARLPAPQADTLAATTSSPWLVLPPALRPREATSDPTAANFLVRSAQRRDALPLARLCTDTFFGTHALADGPIIFVQRLMIWAKVLKQMVRRLEMDDDGRECKLLVATGREEGDEVRACCDVATHLYDKQRQRFELMQDEFPNGREARRRCGWRPYVASMAVASSERRQGLGRRLLREAERTARSWGYRELLLEVATENKVAFDFYERQGCEWSRTAVVITTHAFSFFLRCAYLSRVLSCADRIVSVGQETSGIGATVVRVRNQKTLPFWEVETVEKALMRKAL